MSITCTGSVRKLSAWWMSVEQAGHVHADGPADVAVAVQCLAKHAHAVMPLTPSPRMPCRVHGCHVAAGSGCQLKVRHSGQSFRGARPPQQSQVTLLHRRL